MTMAVNINIINNNKNTDIYCDLHNQYILLGQNNSCLCAGTKQLSHPNANSNFFKCTQCDAKCQRTKCRRRGCCRSDESCKCAKCTSQCEEVRGVFACPGWRGRHTRWHSTGGDFVSIQTDVMLNLTFHSRFDLIHFSSWMRGSWKSADSYKEFLTNSVFEASRHSCVAICRCKAKIICTSASIDVDFRMLSQDASGKMENLLQIRHELLWGMFRILKTI